MSPLIFRVTGPLPGSSQVPGLGWHFSHSARPWRLMHGPFHHLTGKGLKLLRLKH